MPRLTPISRKKFERPIVFTTDKEVPIFIIRNNLRTIGISVSEYLEIIKRLK